MSKRRIFVSLLAACTAIISAQGQIRTSYPLPEEVRHGVLQNGMNYYILHNEEPKERASFYFVQNVGAILEDDNQNGLAHFLEHMAFNGTKHFQGKGIINFLEKHGVRFGYDINAGTSQDQTVYNLSNIPVHDSEGLLDSCLLVLHDWSGYLLLEAEEIEAERGVIHEEWRTRRNSQFRINSQTSKVLYKGSKYADRDVIGDLEIIDNFDHQTLRDYYSKWYRPDQQAVVVVGDIDVDMVESKITELFSKIPLKENLPEREYYLIPDNDELLFGKATDPEAQFMAILLFYKHAADLVKDEKHYRKEILLDLYANIINGRFRELAQDPESNSLMAASVFIPLTRLNNAFVIQAIPKEGKGKESFEEVLTGVERVKRDGFTEAELERSRQQLISQYENYYKNRADITHDSWASQLSNHFLTAEPVFMPETYYKQARETLESISLDELNAICRDLQPDKNQVLLVTGPEKEGIVYPEKDELVEVLERVKSASIDKYEDNVGSEPLVAGELEGSQVTGRFTVAGTDAKGFVLGNGARVILLPTDHSEDEILFSAFSFGGSSLLETDDMASSYISTTIAGQSGIGEFDMIQLQKKLSGKIVRISPSLSELTEGFSGSSNMKDLETLLQLVYLSFEAPRFDEKAYRVIENQFKTIMSNIKADNNQAMQDTITLLSANYNPRTVILNDEFLGKIDFNKTEKIYRDRFRNAADFTFILVGNLEEDEVMPLVSKYIGSISSSGGKETFRDHHIGPPKGKSSVHFERAMEVDKSTVYTSLSGKIKYSRKNQMCVSIVGKLLDKRYLETIREEEGGTYGVSVGSSLNRLPEPEYKLVIQFDTDPEKQERLLGIVNAEIEKLAKSGPIPGDLDDVKKSLVKLRKEQIDQNGFWLGAIRQSLMFDEPFMPLADYESFVNSITAKDIRKTAKLMAAKADRVEVLMNPEK